MVEKSLALVTALSPYTSYDKAAEVAKEAYKSRRTIREIAVEKKVLPIDKLKEILDSRSMTKQR